VLVPESWDNVVSSIVRRISKSDSNSDGASVTVVAACGGKGLGKSTVLQVLQDRILACSDCDVELSYLDTDLGQPQFTTPGLVSLNKIEPQNESSKKRKRTSSSGTNVVEETLFVGDNSPSKHPVVYMTAVKKLISRYYSRASNGNQVLLLNTHGWCSGLGAQLVNAICAFAKVNFVIHMVHSSRADTLDFSGCSSSLKKEYRLEPANVSKLSAVPKEERFRRFVGYFGARSLGDLEARKPIRVALDDINIVTDVSKEESIPEHLWADGLFGAMVGICVTNTDSTVFDCVGLGIIRSIDVEARCLYLITPVAPSVLQASGANTLVLGTQSVPFLRWHAEDSSAIDVSKKPFFAYQHQCVGIVPHGMSCGRSLKRKRLVRR